MAYILPHKRQTKGFPLLNPTPAPDFLTPNNFRKSVNLKSFGEQNNFRGKTIVYRKFVVSKWFSVGLADYSRFSSLVSLQPFSADYFDGNPDRKALSLVLMEGCSEGMPNKLIDTPWLLVAANEKEDLLLAFQHMKREMAQVKPSVVARFGKILFYRLRPNSSVTCKCTVAKDYNKIELYKWGMNGKGWRPWRSERRGAPDLKLQRRPAGALLGAPPQGEKFRAPFGGRWLARRPSPFPRKLNFSRSFLQL
uniref:Polyprotein n=1 Tax=Solanum tuberosum TaxID=4113 RepID=M1E0D0_SOLTU